MSWIELERQLQELRDQNPDHFWNCLQKLVNREGDYLLVDLNDDEYRVIEN